MKTSIIFLSASLASGIASAQSMGNIGYNKSDNSRQQTVYLDCPDPVYFNYEEEEPVVKKTKSKTTVPVKRTKIKAVTTYVAVFSVTQRGRSAASAESLMDQRIRNFRNSVGSMSLGTEEEFISLLPVYEVEEAIDPHTSRSARRLAGFDMKKTVRVSFSNYSMLEKISVKAAGGMELLKVEHIVEQL